MNSLEGDFRQPGLRDVGREQEDPLQLIIDDDGAVIEREHTSLLTVSDPSLA